MHFLHLADSLSQLRLVMVIKTDNMRFLKEYTVVWVTYNRSMRHNIPYNKRHPLQSQL